MIMLQDPKDVPVQSRSPWRIGRDIRQNGCAIPHSTDIQNEPVDLAAPDRIRIEHDHATICSCLELDAWNSIPRMKTRSFPHFTPIIHDPHFSHAE